MVPSHKPAIQHTTGPGNKNGGVISTGILTEESDSAESSAEVSDFERSYLEESSSTQPTLLPQEESDSEEEDPMSENSASEVSETPLLGQHHSPPAVSTKPPMWPVIAELSVMISNTTAQDFQKVEVQQGFKEATKKVAFGIADVAHDGGDIIITGTRSYVKVRHVMFSVLTMLNSLRTCRPGEKPLLFYFLNCSVEFREATPCWSELEPVCR